VLLRELSIVLATIVFLFPSLLPLNRGESHIWMISVHCKSIEVCTWTLCLLCDWAFGDVYESAELVNNNNNNNNKWKSHNFILGVSFYLYALHRLFIWHPRSRNVWRNRRYNEETSSSYKLCSSLHTAMAVVSSARTGGISQLHCWLPANYVVQAMCEALSHVPGTSSIPVVTAFPHVHSWNPGHVRGRYVGRSNFNENLVPFRA
jgi:hypothetical protein